MSEENSNGWNEYSKHVLQELKRFSLKIEELGKEIQQTNQEITKVAGLKHVINDLKEWKEKIEDVTNISDLKNMKKDVEELKVHRVQMVTIGGIIGFILTVINLYAAFYHGG